MKKFIIAAAAAAVGSAFAVESANVVGYVGQTLDETVFAVNVGVCFGEVGSSDAFTVEDEAFGTALNDYDSFLVFDGANYWDLINYTYNGKGKGWVVTYPDEEGTTESVSSFTVNKGSSLFYMGSLTSFNVCGEVSPSGKQTVTFDMENGDFIFDFVNPFPVATTFGDLEEFCNDYDSFLVFDPVNYWDLVNYTYNGKGKGWVVTYPDEEGTSETINDSSRVFLQAGQSAAYMPSKTTTWEVTVNY